jgi:hypothetical protein
MKNQLLGQMPEKSGFSATPFNEQNIGQVDPHRHSLLLTRGFRALHRGSRGDVDLYPVEVSVRYLDVCGRELLKHAGAASRFCR